MRVLLIFACLVGSAASQVERPIPVSITQLLATPERFDGKLVVVKGYLTLGKNPEFVGQQTVLYASEEDAKNLLDQKVDIVPTSDQMKRDREKLNQMYVVVIAYFRMSNNGGEGSLTKVQSVVSWSDPRHPISVNKNEGRRFK